SHNLCGAYVATSHAAPPSTQSQLVDIPIRRPCDLPARALRLAASGNPIDPIEQRSTAGMQAALLPDRAVVKVAGDVARKFLNGLVTSDVDKVAPERAAFAALLTPQGKIIAAFIVAEAPPADGGGFFLDCPRALAPTLVQRLNFYKLRAKVIVEDLSEILGVLAVWDGEGATEYGLCYADPRLPALGLRCMLPPHLAPDAAADLGATLVEPAAYEAHRIALGVP